MVKYVAFAVLFWPVLIHLSAVDKMLANDINMLSQLIEYYGRTPFLHSFNKYLANIYSNEILHLQGLYSLQKHFPKRWLLDSYLADKSSVDE